MNIQVDNHNSGKVDLMADKKRLTPEQYDELAGEYKHSDHRIPEKPNTTDSQYKKGDHLAARRPQ
ncbi:hypothetical protein [Tuberibacillus sp. Marseille-P3662]|uniref:hypothetical protein n=1 Tax=Tuberibacillus sp. Marseille-P3662 TaxID=1965358 RepID=UPI00111C498C|nr:hypothetical protein [Tuberibacillus sp. Marseille-P3662]